MSEPSSYPPFDLTGPLPTPSATTVLEASAGTGKTFTIGALAVRYVAEQGLRLEQLLVVTFGRMASQELRERVRQALADAERALGSDDTPHDPVHVRLADCSTDERLERRRRLSTALADFDAATIATTHQFCQLVLRSLGVAGDTDTAAELVESIDDLVVEVVDDLFLARYADNQPPFTRDVALGLARTAVNDPQAVLDPQGLAPGVGVGARIAFTEAVRAEVERRKRRQGVLTYDDLLSRLADALEPTDSPARDRMRERWRVVLVDEFQDTDPVQWQVLDRAFTGAATLVLIGDPKQAIYAFRGGDVVTYLHAAETATEHRTLAVNHRSDAGLVDALQVLLRGAELGDPRIVVHPVRAQHRQARLRGAPDPAPLRLRWLPRADFELAPGASLGAPRWRAHIARDLAADAARLLAAGATCGEGEDERRLQARDLAVICSSTTDRHVGAIRRELAAHGLASVVSGSTSVLTSQGGDEWLTLLEALEQPQRGNRVRAAALTSFIGDSPTALDAGGEERTDEVAERIREWRDLARFRGIAAVREAAGATGLSARVLGRAGGERLLTDLDHLAEILHGVAHRERLGLPALVEWLRAERRRAAGTVERSRRLDTDAEAVQILTVHASKGLQFPVVYLPALFDRWVPDEPTLRFHDEQGRRTLSFGRDERVVDLATAEDRGEALRLAYVALTRAQSQVVAWWAPSLNSTHGPLSRLLLDRAPGDARVRTEIPPGYPEERVEADLRRWADAGAFDLQVAVPADVAALEREHPPVLDARSFTRPVDTDWRRTSYSGLIRAEEQAATETVHDSEPETEGTVDEDLPEELLAPVAASQDWPVSPMADLPAGAGFGSLVHAVLEHTDATVEDLPGELRRQVAEQLRWWPTEASAEAIAEAMLPMQLTPLGPIGEGLRLADLGPRDRLSELDFEFPLAGGEQPLASVRVAQLADVLRRHLPPEDPMRAYAERLESPTLGAQALRGYLSGSIDVVLRLPSGRFVVVDYKTNRLGPPDEPLTAAHYTPVALTEAMLHSHYPLQALLYSVVLHRYLRWRLGPSYDAERHLGGIAYLYLRGLCGPDTPVVDGGTCGVFSWQPPAAMIADLSDVLAGRADG